MDRTALETLYRERGLARIWDILSPHAKNAIRIAPRPADEASLPLGGSKIGGCPDLPPDVEWFTYGGRPMSFLAQINLREVHPYDSEGRLPATGILYFFYDSEQEVWGFDPSDADGSRVYFHDGDPAQLRRRPLPESLCHDEDGAPLIAPCALSLSAECTLPSLWSSLAGDIDYSEEEFEAYFALMEELGEEQFKLLGHSDNVQGGMELECELVTNGISCGTPEAYNHPRFHELEPNAGRWHLLFQMDSSDTVGTMWGDMGRIYYWIREEHLQARRFGESWAILQCY
ncbi:MAG: peptide methionine sulfoxide reductase [Bacteroidia bacterium]|nr:MAG: peptide methionine sulfoxide reductase [Bacteroidia bacterium]